MINPKDYQSDALNGISRARHNGQKRALIVMASGLGKTVTAALDVKRFLRKRPNAKVLFLCHQNDILEQAQLEFARVFTLAHHTMGFYHGQRRERAHEVQFLFASFQTMREWRTNFKKHHFDYVVVDESHHTPAATYEPTVEYFKPQFMLALTATPERTDLDDIRRIYGKEVYSLPLEDALARGLLTQIDYRLLTDEIAYRKILTTPRGKLSIKDLNNKFFIKKRDEEIVGIIQRRIRNVSRPKVIIFCRTTHHCDRLAKLLPGAVAIHHKLARAEQKLRLQQFREQQRGIVLTVDMFNEGIDVPEANVIVFLRSTAAPIVFYQQLGRGLREHHGKEKVLVLDFVANCERLLMLDGLFQLVRRHTRVRGNFTRTEPFNINVGQVHFTEAAQALVKILKQIRTGYTKAVLVSQLVNLAEDLGRTPRHEDIQQGSKDGKCASVYVFMDRFGSLANAFRAAGLEVNKEYRYSQEMLTDQLKALAKELGHVPRAKDIDDASKKRRCPSSAAFINAFGSINQALEASGLEISNRSKTTELSDDDLIAKLKSLAEKLGHTPSQADMTKACAEGEFPSPATYSNRFGSLFTAYRKAGFEDVRGRRPYTRKEMIQDLKDLAKRLGRAPSTADIEEACHKRECVGTQSLRAMFGSIAKALKAAGLEPSKLQEALS